MLINIEECDNKFDEKDCTKVNETEHNDKGVEKDKNGKQLKKDDKNI